MAEVVDILGDLRTSAEAVEKAANQLHRDTLNFTGKVDENGEWIEGVGPRYEQALDDELIRIEEVAFARDKRPPATDIRQAMARRKVREEHPELHAEHMQLSATIEATQKWISNRKAAMNAKQSVLRGERS